MSIGRNIFKRFLAYIGITIAFLLLLVVIIAIFLTLPPGEKILKGIIQNQIGQHIQLDTRIDFLETNLTSRLILKNLEIKNGAKKDSDNLLVIDSLLVNYDIWKLLNKNIFVESINVDGIYLNLERSVDNKFNITLLDSILSDTSIGQESTPGYSLDISSINLNDGNINFRDYGQNLNFEAINISSEVRQKNIGQYDCRLLIDSMTTVYDTLPAIYSSVNIVGRIDEKSVSIDTIKTNFDDINLTANMKVSLDETKSITASVKIIGNPSNVWEKFRDYFDLPSVEFKNTLQVECTAEGTINQPQIGLVADLPGIKADNLSLEQNRLVASYDDGIISVDTLHSVLLGGGALLYGKIDLDSLKTITASINLSSVDLAAAWTGIYGGVSPYKGIIDGNMALSGSGGNYSDYLLEADLQMKKLIFENQALPDVNILASYKNKNLMLKAEHSLFNINAKGKVDGKSFYGNYNIDIEDIEPLAGLFNIMDLSGRLSAGGAVSGKVNSPTITSEIDIHNLKYQNIPIDTLHASISYAGDILYIDDAFFEGRVISNDPEDAPFFQDSINGYYAYEGQISGDLGNLKGHIHLSADSLYYNHYGIDSLRADINVSGEDLIFDKFYIYKKSLQTDIDGNFNYENLIGRLDINLFDLADSSTSNLSVIDTISFDSSGTISSEFNISDRNNLSVSLFGKKIDLHPIIAAITDSISIDGELDCELSFSGNIERPNLNFNGKIIEPSINDISLDSLTAQVKLSEDILKLEKLNLFGMGQRFQAGAFVELIPDTGYLFNIASGSRFGGRLFCDNFDLDIINAFISPSYEIKGNCTVDLEWDGLLSSPNIDGSLSLDSGYLFLGSDFQTVSGISLQSTVNDSVLTINQCVGKLDQYPFEISGSLLLSNHKAIKSDIVANLSHYGVIRSSGILSKSTLNQSLSIDSLDLSVFDPFLSQVSDFEGIAECHIMLQGKLDDPQIDGNLSIRQLAFQSAYIPSKFENGNVRIRFGNDNIRVDSIYTAVGGGRLFISGDLTHDNARITDIDLYLNLDSVKLNSPKEYLANVNSVKLHYTKPNENYLLDGDIKLGECRLLYGFRPQSILPTAKSVEKTEFELPEILMQTNMNIRIRESNNLWIDNNLAKLRLHAELGIIGSFYKPNLSGRINYQEGYLLYLDRKFLVEKGDVYFSDPAKFNPEIHLLAEANITSYEHMQATEYVVTFSAEGSLEKLIYGWSSEPYLEESDIISLLTFGSTRSQLAGKDADSKGVLKERAEMLTSRGISNYFSRKTGSFLGLDEMSVEGNLFQLNKNGGPQITASKSITKSAKLTYSTTVGHINDQSIRLDYLLKKHYSLMGQTDRMGRSSVDIKYSIRFR